MLTAISVSDLELNPFTTIGKDTMLVTAGTPGHCNTMTAAWGGMGFLWDREVLFAAVRKSRYTHEFLDGASRFSCSFFPAEYRKALTYLGTHSGRKEDKIARSGLTLCTLEDGGLGFREANLVFSCTKLASVDIDPAHAFVLPEIVRDVYQDKDWHTLFIGAIDTVYADI